MILTTIILVSVAALTLLIVRTKRQSTNILDTSRVLNSPVAAIKKFTSRLLPRAWIIVIFVLSLLFGFGSNFETDDWLFYKALWCTLLMILAVGLSMKLPNHGLKIAACAVFIIGSLLPSIFSSSYLAADIYGYIMVITLAWLILQLFAISALQSWEKELKYPAYIIGWLLVFALSFGFKELMFIAIAGLLLIKGYQLFLVDKWTLKRAKEYAFSLLYPVGLCAVLLIYVHYATQIVENKANEVAQQTLAYYDKNGNYPTQEQVKVTRAEDDIWYVLNKDGEPFLSYWEPATIMICRFNYDFESRSWREYCMD